jgi:hypothetical protein
MSAQGWHTSGSKRKPWTKRSRTSHPRHERAQRRNPNTNETFFVACENNTIFFFGYIRSLRTPSTCAETTSPGLLPMLTLLGAADNFRRLRKAPFG